MAFGRGACSSVEPWGRRRLPVCFESAAAGCLGGDGYFSSAGITDSVELPPTVGSEKRARPEGRLGWLAAETGGVFM